MHDARLTGRVNDIAQRRWLARAAVVSSLACATLFGCARTPPPDPEPVLVGLVVEQDYAVEAGIAAALVERELRSAGGVLGRPFDVVERVLATATVAAVEEPLDEFVNELRVSAVVGPATDPGTVFIAQGPTFEARTPHIVPFAVSELRLFEVQPEADRYLFFLSPPAANGAFLRFAETILEEGCTSLGIVSIQLGVDGSRREFGPAYDAVPGAEIIGYPVNTSAQYSSDTYVNEVLAGNHDCVGLYGIAEDNAAFVNAFRRLPGSESVRFVGNANVQLPAFLDRVRPEDIEDTLSLSFFATDDSREEFRSLDAETRAVVGELTDSQVAIVAGFYDALMLTAFAIERAESDLPSATLRDEILSSSRPGSASDRIARPLAAGRTLSAIRAGSGINYEGALSNSDINALGYVDRTFSLVRYTEETGWAFFSSL